MNIINNCSQKDLRQRLRNNMPKPEQILWYFLRRRQLGGVKFRRQVSIGKYIVDFCSFERKLIIEVDGDSHFFNNSAKKYDQIRSKFLEQQGFSVLRFSNIEVMKNGEECVNKVLDLLGTEFVTPLRSPLKGEKVKGRAFTLIELVVTMSLMGILFAISAPIFAEFQTSSRLKSSSQIVETVFGEAFSSARSRPECFVVSGNESVLTLENFKFKNRECLETAENSREFQLNSGVSFADPFEVKFKPPFGDIEILDDENNILKIKMCNEECVFFQINKKSGLFSRVSNQNPDA